LIIQTIELLVAEYEVIVFDIEQWTRVTGAPYRTATLTGELTIVHIILYAFYNQQHAAINAFFFLKGHIGPTQGVNILLNALFEGVKHLFVGTLYLIRIDSDSTSEFLCPYASPNHK
jgi:hypothetical protein